MKMPLLLLLTVLIPSVFSADHNLFKNCSRTFCSELRSLETPEESYYYADLVENNPNLAFDLTNEHGDPKLTLTIDDSEELYGNWRVLIDDPQSPRYKLKHVLRENIAYKKNKKSRSIKYDTNKWTISEGYSSLVVFQGPPFSLHFYEDDKLLVGIDGSSFVWQNDTQHFAFNVSMEYAEVLYGLFHHADTMALRETASGGSDPYRLRNSDTSGYEVNSTMALYGSVPVIYGHSKTLTTGIFLHNAAEQWIDVSYGDADNTTSVRFMVDAGAFDLFVLPGPRPDDVVRQYTDLTGKAPLPALWTLGYHQSRWSYYTQEEVEGVIANMDDNDFPIDAVWLDIDYTDGKRYFTWNPENFSDPLALQEKVDSTNRKLVVIMDPHIKVDDDYFVYVEAKEKGLFVKNPDGTDYEGDCWPGLSSYLDFLNQDTTEFYSSLYSYEKFVNSTSVIAGIWNDMNEPSVFDDSTEKTLPFDAVHFGDVEHRNVHNIYGFLQTKATYEGLLHRNNGTARPFVLSRSTFAGSQRYAAMWTGDNTASWGHLAVSFSECLTANILGQAWCGADIGGFHDVPDDGLVSRWYQAAAWLPFFRGHAEEGQPRREPYVYPDNVQNIIRAAIKQRYEHIPQWYTLFHEHALYGTPVIAPLFYHFGDDPQVFTIDNQLLLGSDIMVRQVAEPNATSVDVYFPFRDWYQANDDTVHEGLQWEKIEVDESFIPVFYAAGGIILRKPIARRNTKEMEDDPIDLHVYLNRRNYAVGWLYLDDGATFNYDSKEDYDYYFTSYDGVEDEITLSPMDDKDTPDYIQIGQIIVYSLPENSSRIAKKKIYNATSEGTPLKDLNLAMEFQKNKKIAIKL